MAESVRTCNSECEYYNIINSRPICDNGTHITPAPTDRPCKYELPQEPRGMTDVVDLTPQDPSDEELLTTVHTNQTVIMNPYAQREPKLTPSEKTDLATEAISRLDENARYNLFFGGGSQ